MVSQADLPPMPPSPDSFEEQRLLEAEIQGILRAVRDPAEATSAILAALQVRLDVEAVALRLAQDDDFTYAAHRGFPGAFIEAENCLRAHSQRGEPLFDELGAPLFECVCGLVLTGRTDAANPLYSPGGSAWTNDARPVVDLRAGEAPQVLTRNRCLEAGYRSIAIIPIRVQGVIVGAFQLNDKRPGRFHPERIDFLEGLAARLGSLFG